jgi:CRP-like cAMP-binding protein
MEVMFCNMQAFNVRFGEKIALKRGTPIFRNRSANRTNEIQRRIMLVHFRFLAPFSQKIMANSEHSPARQRFDQLFNSSEKRLARILLILSESGEPGKTEHTVLHITQEALAEMVSTTRSRVCTFMNRFREHQRWHPGP